MTKTGAKTERYPENGGSKEVNKIFADLREAIDGLEKIVNGQREINGNFYAVLNAILDKTGFPKNGRKSSYEPITPETARKLASAIPAINPPGCQEPERPGGG